MQSYIDSYGIILAVTLIAMGLMVGISLFLLVVHKSGYRKVQRSPYECGFMPFDDARVRFDVKFYRVAIMFMVFDVEMVLLMPFIYVMDTLSFLGLVSVSIFFFILVIGFLYEWRQGALEWESSSKIKNQ